MSKHIIFDDDLYRIDLGDGEWIDILEKSPHSTKRKAMASMLRPKGRAVGGDKEPYIAFDYDAGAFNGVLLCNMIKAWSFKDKSGEALAVKPENIDRLDEATADLVLETINRLNPKRDEAGKNVS